MLSYSRISKNSFGTHWFITVFTRTHHQPLSLARSIQSITYHPISLRSFMIISLHLHLGLPKSPLIFPQKPYINSSPLHSCPLLLTYQISSLEHNEHVLLQIIKIWVKFSKFWQFQPETKLYTVFVANSSDSVVYGLKCIVALRHPILVIITLCITWTSSIN